MMSWREWKSLFLAGILVQAALAISARPAVGQLDLGPEEFVQAGGADIDVPGYSVPSFVYWDGDDLKDLIIGQGGGGVTQAMVRVYLNVGTSCNPQFSGYFYAQSNGGDLVLTASGCLGLFPRVVYWDADDRKDLLVGEALGTVTIFLNIGTDEDPSFDGGTRLQVGTPGSKTDIDVGSRATSTVVDWNNDDRKDLVVGALDGLVRIYINEGTDNSPDFRSEMRAQAYGADLVVPTARSSPEILDLDNDGRKDLLTGNTEGQLLFYSNTGSDQDPSFTDYSLVEADGTPINLPGLPRSRPYLCHWTPDGLVDVLIGASDGMVHLYQGVINTDCNGNGILDEDDILSGTSLDCNENCIPDECDIDPADPDGNGLVSDDCDGNFWPDECQTDCDGGGVFDGCEMQCDPLKGDYNGDLFVTMAGDWNGFLTCMNGPQAPIPLWCQICDFDDDGDVDLQDFSAFQVAIGTHAVCLANDCNTNVILDSCDIAAGTSLDCNESGIPDECEGGPWPYGDVDGSGEVNLNDLLCLLDGLSGLFTCPGVTFEDLDIDPCDGGNSDLNLMDLFAMLDALAGSPPCLCP